MFAACMRGALDKNETETRAIRIRDAIPSGFREEFEQAASRFLRSHGNTQGRRKGFQTPRSRRSAVRVDMQRACLASDTARSRYRSLQ
jgi:hypothetical protein